MRKVIQQKKWNYLKLQKTISPVLSVINQAILPRYVKSFLIYIAITENLFWSSKFFSNSYLLNLYFRTVQARLLATTAVKLGIRQKIAHWIIKVLTLTWRAIIVIKLDTVKEIVPRKKVSSLETFLYSRPEVLIKYRLAVKKLFWHKYFVLFF